MTMKAILIAIALCWSASAWGQESLETQVLSIDTVPSRAQLDAHGPGVQSRLIMMAMDPNQEIWARVRALNALSAYPNQASRTTLLILAQNPHTTLRGQALYTLARTFGKPGDARLVEHLKEALHDDQKQVRQLALRGLRWVDDPAAGTLLNMLSSDTDSPLARLARHVQQRRAERLAQHTPSSP